MGECFSALVAYFKEELPRLEQIYQWKIPKIEGFDDSGEEGYLPNVRLKKHFISKWKRTDKVEEKQFGLAKVIVADWSVTRIT